MHWSLLVGLLALAVVIVVLVLRQQAPPEAARLLPESDAIVYVHLKTLRTLARFDSDKVTRSASLQQFVDATGIDPERDLDSAALAFHRIPSAGSRDSKTPSADLFVSEVFIGRFDGQKLSKYLQSISTGRESYAGHDVYAIPMDSQTLRVTQLGYDTIVASNMPTAEQMHSMLDRYRASALWTPGSSLLAARYSEVPLLSQAWAIGHIGLPFSEHGYISVLGMELPLREDTDLVASLRYSGSVHLRIEEIASKEEDAKHTVDTMTTLLNIFRGIQDAQPAATPGAVAMRSVVDSLALEQHKDRAVLSAAATTDQIRALASAAKAPAVPDAAPTPPAPSKP